MPKILDDGFVNLVRVSGDDAAICEAARLTSQSSAADDRTLIRYLMRHRHSTPFEFVDFTFHVRCPMDCWRQWIRHRTASVNEYSTRYSEAIDSMQKTPPGEWRLQSQANRQGSSDKTLDPTEGENLSYREEYFHAIARNVYSDRLAAGVAKEQARKDLPLSTYTEAYWKINLHNLLHFLGLRMDAHAQHEIRQYANAIGEIVAERLPITWEAFVDYRLAAVTLTRLDVEVIQRLYGRNIPVDVDTFIQNQDNSWHGLERCRERDECLAKLQRLGIVQL